MTEKGRFQTLFDTWFLENVKTPIVNLQGSLKTEISKPIKDAVGELKDVIPDVTTKVGEIIAPLGEIKEKIEEIVTNVKEMLGKFDSIANPLSAWTEWQMSLPSLSMWADDFITQVFTKIKPNLVQEMKTEIALSTIHEEDFETEDMQDKIKDLKAKWANSPESASDIANDLMEIVKGKAAKVQLEAVSGISFGDDTPIASGLFNQMAIVTDVTLATNLVAMISEVLSLGQVDKIGTELRAYMDYSGVSQITGFGYGTLFSSVLSGPLTQEINQKLKLGPIDPRTLVSLKYKELIVEPLYNKHMNIQGFGDEQITAFEEDFKFYPTPQDLVHWMSKEVFEQDSIDKYGLLNEFDKLDLQQFKKAGVAPDQVKNFWIAHWQSPSFNQVTDMLFRGLISEKDVYEWYRLVEIAPFWREKLTKIQYHPYTRVDIRRMYTAGVVDKATVKRTYLDLGYDDEKAENLTKWTVAEKMASERDLSKTESLRLYREGQITKDKLVTEMTKLGYDDAESNQIVTLADIVMKNAEEKALVATWTDLFKIHTIDLKLFKNNLDTLSLTEIKKNRIIARAERVEKAFITLPSKDDCKRWFKGGHIEEKEFIGRMQQLGYQTEDIDLDIMEIYAQK